MRLIIKEYLATLKEKDELDYLVADLLLEQRYITDNKPETGNRQFGVDIQAHKGKELLLCVIKQGNLNRQNWDCGNPQDVRPSIVEILEVYLRMLSEEQLREKIRIAVVMNGVLDEGVRFNWEGFVELNKTWGGRKLSLELWNIDKLVDETERYLLNEHLFTNGMQSLLRKALYFAEEPDYKKQYYEQIIDAYMERMRGCTKKRQFQKEAASLHLATQMIGSYAATCGIYKIGIMCSEYLIIRYWKLLLEKNYFEKMQYVQWLHTYCKSYEKWNERYFEAVRPCCYEENIFPTYNSVERKVMMYEMLGYLSSYAYYLSGINERKSLEILDGIVALINENMEFFYPPYDGCIGTINSILRLLVRYNKRKDMRVLVQQLAFHLVRAYRENGWYPTGTDSFEDAVYMLFGQETEEYQASGLWGMLLEWFVALEMEKEYEAVREFLAEDLKAVTKCIWFLRQEEELLFYDAYAMNLAGEGVSVHVEKNFKELVNKMRFVWKQYEKEVFSYEKYCFPALELMVCRYYDYVPRVCYDW